MKKNRNDFGVILTISSFKQTEKQPVTWLVLFFDTWGCANSINFMQ